MRAGAITSYGGITAPSLNGQGNPNLIRNGDFEVAQRGSSFVALTGGYCIDGYALANGSDAVVTITQDTDTPPLSASGYQSRHSLKIQVTTQDVSIGAGQYLILYQPIEGFDFYQAVGRSVTLSFWVKAKKTGVYCVSFKNSVSDRSQIKEYTISLADTWEKKVITLAMDYSGGTWNYTTGAGLYIDWMLAAGSTYQNGKDSWIAGNYLVTANQVNALDSTSNYVNLSQVKLEVGSQATPFAPLPYQQELARCQRRLCVLSNPSVRTYAVYGSGRATASNSALIHIPLPVSMASEPTLIFNGSWAIFGINAASPYLSYSIAGASGSNGVGVIITTTGGQALTTGQFCTLQNNGDGNATIYISCEL